MMALIKLSRSHWPLPFQLRLLKISANNVLKTVYFTSIVFTGIEACGRCRVINKFFKVGFLVLSTNQTFSLVQESSGHLPHGIFGSDNIHADGLFDECLSIRAPFFNGKYCTVFFKSTSINPQEIISVEDTNQTGVTELSNVLTLIHLLGLTSGSDRVEPQLSVADSGTSMLPSISFCLPSSCSAEDLGQSVAQQIGSYIFANNKSIVTVADPGYCFEDLRTPNSFDGAEITVM